METTITTSIKKAFVYQQGARLVHEAHVELKEGQNRLKIERMTKFLDKESVRVKGTGNGTIININIEKHTSEISKLPELDNLRAKIEKLDQKIQKNTSIMEQLEASNGDFSVFASNFFKRAPVYFNRAELDLEKITSMDNYIQDRKLKFIDDVQKIEMEKQKLEKERQYAQRELQLLARVSRDSVEEFYEIIILLEAKKAGKFELEIEFQIKKAHWIPFYDVNLQENSAQIKLMANVYNRSQEDWSNIELDISSASLQPVRIVKPHPYIVKEFVPISYKSKSRKRMAASPKMMRGPMGPPSGPPGGSHSAGMANEVELHALHLAVEPAPELAVNQAKISENMGVQSYVIPERIDIPSDSQPHPVTLMEITLKSKKGYFWSSAASSMVIIQDTLENEDFLLFPGNAKVYFMNEFIGESQIPLIAPKEKIELGTRRTYDLKVEKRLKSRKVSKEGILKGKITKSYEYEIKITVFKPNDHVLKLMDSMVHSNSEKIKIGKTTFSLEPKSQDLGILTWELPLKDKKEILLTYSFEVTWEKDIKISPALP